MKGLKIKKWNAQFGVGVWDSWGFGISFCPWSKGFVIEFIHWYAYVEVWKEKETQ